MIEIRHKDKKTIVTLRKKRMTYPTEKIRPFPHKEESKGAQVEIMFDEIAGRYDNLNHLLSWGIDKSWRKKGILTLKDLQPQKLLDIATGTGDLALQAYPLLHPEKITCIDISEKMMEIGRKKTAEAGLPESIVFERQDCMNLSFEDHSFDAAMMAFGIRNFENPDRGLQEILRVLRPGGRLTILELSSPEQFPLKQAYRLYSKWIIPTVGQWISQSKPAYTYLPESIAAFPQNEKMKFILEKNGFVRVRYQKLTGGICTLYTGEKCNLSGVGS
jgi:demethylmenaquinone methyltransferase/2-methoxy-6-polyprenyl-1,4-benzoquinol methylase